MYNKAVFLSDISIMWSSIIRDFWMSCVSDYDVLTLKTLLDSGVSLSSLSDGGFVS